MAAGRGGDWQGVTVALLFLCVLRPAGAASAAALPVVINTWAFRTAAETGVPAGSRAAAGRVGRCCVFRERPPAEGLPGAPGCWCWLRKNESLRRDWAEA